VRLSRERLTTETEATGFRPEVLERVIHLLNLLSVFQRHPALGGCLALKGGTINTDGEWTVERWGRDESETVQDTRSH
jgi:hypothetical protein